MADEESLQELQDLIQRVVEVETDDLSKLAEIAGLNQTKDFAGSDLSVADLSGADLSDADLSGADLRGTDLSGADLSGADLIGAFLSDADLSGADLRGADLRVADLRGARLIGADLSKTKVEKTLFGDNLGISEQMKRDLIQRGAIFEDSPGDRDRSLLLTPR